MREEADGWRTVEVVAEEMIWQWDCGSFPVSDGTGTVLIAPTLLDHSIALTRKSTSTRGVFQGGSMMWGVGRSGPPSASAAFGAVTNHGLDRFPLRMIVDELTDAGGEEDRYRGGAIGALRGRQPQLEAMLHRFASPDAKTFGYRVTEEVIAAGVALNVVALTSQLIGQTVLARPYRGVAAISVGPLPTVLLRGARRAARWTATLVITALILLGAGGVLLIPALRAGR